MYPKKFEDLIAAFRHLPGVGIKTAERYAFTVLDWDQETLEEMIASLQAVRNGLDVCEVCGNLCEGSECEICSDHTPRSSDHLCRAEPERCDRDGKDEYIQWRLPCAQRRDQYRKGDHAAGSEYR